MALCSNKSELPTAFLTKLVRKADFKKIHINTQYYKLGM